MKTKLVRAKLDQANQQVLVSSTMHRTFTKQHWNNLHGLLTSWRSNLHSVREQIGHLATAQVELMRQQAQATSAAAAAAPPPSSSASAVPQPSS